jgi:hypothetical protein
MVVVVGKCLKKTSCVRRKTFDCGSTVVRHRVLRFDCTAKKCLRILMLTGKHFFAGVKSN